MVRLGGERFPPSEQPRSQLFELVRQGVAWLGAGREEGLGKKSVQEKPVLEGSE